MFIIVDINRPIEGGHARYAYVNVDNIRQIMVWENSNAEKAHERFVVTLEFMNGTEFEYMRFPTIETLEKEMSYIFANAFKIGAKRNG